MLRCVGVVCLFSLVLCCLLGLCCGVFACLVSGVLCLRVCFMLFCLVLVYSHVEWFRLFAFVCVVVCLFDFLCVVLFVCRMLYCFVGLVYFVLLSHVWFELMCCLCLMYFWFVGLC